MRQRELRACQPGPKWRRGSRSGREESPTDNGAVPSVSAVLPAYNEQAVIGETATTVAQALARCADDYEVIVVDDGSRDRTRQVVEQLAKGDARIRCVSHSVNRGYGEALHTGFNAATKQLIFVTDGDGQFDPHELPQFLNSMQAADLVIGYRAPRRDPWLRRLYGWGWTLLVNLVFGYAARDVDCAFKLIKREVWQRVQVHSGGATFSAELVVKARRCGYRVIELPVTHRPRTAGSATGAHPRVILRAFRELVWLRLHLKPCVPP